MSASRRNIALVSRSYQPDAESCVRVLLELALRKPVKQGAVPASRPDDGTKIKEDSANARSISRQ